FKQALLHVGIQASKNQGHSISFLPGGSEKIADDSPLAVYQRLFQGSGMPAGASDTAMLKNVEKELQSFLAKTDIERERNKLQQHLQQIQVLLRPTVGCSGYDLSTFAYDDSKKWEDKTAPVIMKMQMSNLVQPWSAVWHGWRPFSFHGIPVRSRWITIGSIGGTMSGPWRVTRLRITAARSMRSRKNG
ncbi:MAG: hypothetical protein M3Q07_13950, partial [Pseudobdellovibrionaceae bacterium]|nr:hypothetical protein [Pseudobdellovibrionaceae bacterium]